MYERLPAEQKMGSSKSHRLMDVKQFCFALFMSNCIILISYSTVSLLYKNMVLTFL